MGSQLEMLAKEYNKKYGQDIIYNGKMPLIMDRIRFTSEPLNDMTYGGLPSGIIVEFFGDEASGKTTTALDIVKNAQDKFKKDFEEGKTKIERICCFIDAENTLDEDWAKKLGVDIEKIMFIRPSEQSAEQIFDMMKDVIETGECGLIVLDSLATLVSQQIFEESFEKKAYGGIATPLTRFCNEIISKLKKYDCLCIMINQVRENLTPYGSSIKTPGGKGFKHHCSIRMQFKKDTNIDETGKDVNRDSNKVVGNLVAVKLVKSKVCKQDRINAFYTLRYNEGIDYVADLVTVGLIRGLISQAGSSYRLLDKNGEVVILPNGKESVKGKTNLRNLLYENKELYEMLVNQIYD